MPKTKNRPRTRTKLDTIKRHTAQPPPKRPRGFPKGQKIPRNPGHQETRKLRKVRALELRISGLLHREIAEQLKIEGYEAVSLSTTANDIRRMVKRLDQREFRLSSRLKTIELARLEAQTKTLWPRQGDEKVARVLVNISQRRAKLAGLDAPIEVRDLTDESEANILAKLSPDTLARVLAELESAAPSEDTA
jgi:hypothetical protein